VSKTLASALLDALDESGRASLRGELDSLRHILDTALETVSAAWPGVRLAPDVFAGAIAERLDTPSLEALESLRLADLYVATACAQGDARAIARVTSELLRPAVRAAMASDPAIDDVLQKLTVRFFVGTEEAPGRITQYAGRGTLKAWARVAVLRAVKDLNRGRARAPREDGFIDDLLAQPGGSDPEIDEIKTQCRDEFRAAFTAAVDGLDPDDRRMLRMHHLRGVTLEQLARIDGVHRVTAARRLARARRQLLDRTRSELAERLRASGRDIDSVLDVVASRLEVSVDRLLATRGE